MKEFQDIKIQRLDAELTDIPTHRKRQPRVEPLPNELTFQFVLSHEAPEEWAKKFNDRWKGSDEGRRFPASVSGAALQVRAPLGIFENDNGWLFPRLKNAVSAANEDYRQYLAAEAKEKESEEEQRQRVRAIASQLPF